MTPLRFSSQISPFALAVMARLLCPGSRAGKLGNIGELVDLAGGLQRGGGPPAYERTGDRKRIGPALKVSAPLPTPDAERKTGSSSPCRMA